MSAEIATAPQEVKRGSGPFGQCIAPSAEKTRATTEGGYKKRHSYKALPRQFRHGGFDYQQITRERNAAIYQQICNGCSNPNVAYEIIRVRRREGFEIGGRFVEPAEVYPNSEAWGVDGWTMHDKGAAFRKLRAVVFGGGALRSVVLHRHGTIKGKRLLDCVSARAIDCGLPQTGPNAAQERKKQRRQNEKRSDDEKKGNAGSVCSATFPLAVLCDADSSETATIGSS